MIVTGTARDVFGFFFRNCAITANFCMGIDIRTYSCGCTCCRCTGSMNCTMSRCDSAAVEQSDPQGWPVVVYNVRIPEVG